MVLPRFLFSENHNQSRFMVCDNYPQIFSTLTYAAERERERERERVSNALTNKGRLTGV